MTIQAIYWYNGSNTVNICLLQHLYSNVKKLWEAFSYQDHINVSEE